MIQGFYEQILIGQTFESGGRTVSEALDLQFSMLSGDWHPIHSDAEYARRTSFGERIAHGMLTLSVVSGLMTLSPHSIEAFYGLDRVRFLRPVRFGDTIRVLSRIAEKAPLRAGKGIISVDVTVANQRDETVLSMTMKFLVASSQRSTSVAIRKEAMNSEDLASHASPQMDRAPKAAADETL